MWREMARIIGEIQPRFVFVENSPRLTSRGLGRVLGDLASMGFDAKWGVLGGKEFGASHSRDRIWILASNPTKDRRIQISNISQGIGIKGKVWDAQEFNRILDDCPSWEGSKRGMDLLGDGLAEWVGQSEALGNGQIPVVAATAWGILSAQSSKG
jgi:DNA (cytosine-5)-methyltransferase 1